MGGCVSVCGRFRPGVVPKMATGHRVSARDTLGRCDRGQVCVAGAVRPVVGRTVSSCGTANEETDDVYWWTIGQNAFGDGPRVIWIEGRELGEHTVRWQLRKSDGINIVARDTVKLSVEPIVWPSNETEDEGKSEHTSKWPDEGVNLLMTGIAYGSAYPQGAGPNDIFMLDFHAPNPQTPDYHQTLVNNAGRFSDDEHTLKVILQPVGAGTYDVKTYLVSNGTEDLLYHNPQVTHGTGTTGQQYALADVPANQRTVRLQTHWDSGVIFTAVTITDPPE